MAQSLTDGARLLRLWPAVAIVAIQLLLRFVVPIFNGDLRFVGVIGLPIGAALIGVWWMLFSRATWTDRLLGAAAFAVSLFLMFRFSHPSLVTGGQGYLLYVIAVPTVAIAFVAWAALARGFGPVARRATMVATLLLASGAWTLGKTGGVTGDFRNDLTWRWTETPEDRAIARARAEEATLKAAPPVARAAEAAPAADPAKSAEAPKPAERTSADASPAKAAVSGPLVPADVVAPPGSSPEWPGFRGPDRTSVITTASIATDWTSTAPVELWRRTVGPGWSSFSVHGDRLFTQEQMGDDEIVACYDAKTGAPVWKHKTRARFWESNAGAGPRGTPTLANGRVYALGGTGIVTALRESDGALLWSRDSAADTGSKLPTWGYSGSPLVLPESNTVLIASSGTLIAYDATTGEKRWAGPVSGASYSSPHAFTLEGVPQVVLISAIGLSSYSPADGALLWKHEWKGYPIVQPAATPDGDLLIAASESSGLRRLDVVKTAGGWAVAEKWTTIGLKPYFSDFVVHKGHAYGFDGGILACVDLADGKRKWKGGRLGHGQMMLLPDQDLLFVLSEEGELVLARAATDAFTEIARFPAITGKTWGHPALVGDVIYVRNAEEMAAFRLPLSKGTATADVSR